MKTGCILALLAAAGCSSAAPRTAPRADVEPARDLVDRLRIEREYRPAPTASEPVSTFYDLPRGAWIAQGWWYDDCWRPWWKACRTPLRRWCY